MDYTPENLVSFPAGHPAGLDETIRAAGHDVEHHNGQAYADDAAAVQAIINGYDSATFLATQARAALVVAASESLIKSDLTMLRISEAVASGANTWTSADVVEWVTWRRALRAIVNGEDTTSTEIPARPSNYPAGT